MTTSVLAHNGQVAMRYAAMRVQITPLDPATLRPYESEGFRAPSRELGIVRARWLAQPDALVGLEVGGATNVDVLYLKGIRSVRGQFVSAPVHPKELGTGWQTSAIVIPDGGALLLFWHEPGGTLKISDPEVEKLSEGEFIVLPTDSVASGKGLYWRGDKGLNVERPRRWPHELLQYPPKEPESPPIQECADFEQWLAAPAPEVQMDRVGLVWRAGADIQEACERSPRTWYWPGVLASGTCALVAGLPKGGKSTLVWGFLAALERGDVWLGARLPKTKAIIVTEESDHDVLAKLQKFDLRIEDGRVLSRSAVRNKPEWGGLGDAISVRARDVEARVIVIDTLSFWAQLAGDAERSESATRELMEVVHDLTREGLAVILIHHLVKNEDVKGLSAVRGSGNIAAEAETIMLVKGKHGSHRRHLEIYARSSDLAAIDVEFRPGQGGAPATYVIAEEQQSGATPERKLAAAEVGVFDHLQDIQKWRSVEAIAEEARLKTWTVTKACRALQREGRIQKRYGTRGFPVEYAALDVPTEAVANSIASPATPPDGCNF